jgi:hypothetical protein
VLGLCLSLVCIDDFPHSVIAFSNTVLSADDTMCLPVFWSIYSCVCLTFSYLSIFHILFIY